MYLIALQANLIAYGKIGKGKKVDREGEQMAIKKSFTKLSFKCCTWLEQKLNDVFLDKYFCLLFECGIGEVTISQLGWKLVPKLSRKIRKAPTSDEL